MPQTRIRGLITASHCWTLTTPVWIGGYAAAAPPGDAAIDATVATKLASATASVREGHCGLQSDQRAGQQSETLTTA